MSLNIFPCLLTRFKIVCLGRGLYWIRELSVHWKTREMEPGNTSWRLSFASAPGFSPPKEPFLCVLGQGKGSPSVKLEEYYGLHLCVYVHMLLPLHREELLSPAHPGPAVARSLRRRGLAHSAFDWPACRRRSRRGLASAVDASGERLLLPYSDPTFFLTIAMVTTSLPASLHLPRRRPAIGCLSRSRPVIGPWWNRALPLPCLLGL